MVATDKYIMISMVMIKYSLSFFFSMLIVYWVII